MADEEIVSGLKQVKDEITRQREDDSKQTGQLAESINKLRAESNQKSDGIVGTLTSSLEKNAAEVASEFIIQRADHRWQKEAGITEVDDKVDELHGTVRGGNVERKSLLQRIAAWVNPDMQGSKDRERDTENKLNFDKQLKFFANMSKSHKGMVVKPLRATTASNMLSTPPLTARAAALTNPKMSSKFFRWSFINHYPDHSSAPITHLAQ